MRCHRLRHRPEPDWLDRICGITIFIFQSLLSGLETCISSWVYFSSECFSSHPNQSTFLLSDRKSIFLDVILLGASEPFYPGNLLITSILLLYWQSFDSQTCKTRLMQVHVSCSRPCQSPCQPLFQPCAFWGVTRPFPWRSFKEHLFMLRKKAKSKELVVCVS